MKNFSSNLFLLFPILIFSLLYLPFWGSIPHLDGNIDFVKAYDFLKGGVPELFDNWNSTHPPVKEIIVSFFFKIFGVGLFPYSLTGYIFGILSLIFMFFFTKKLFGEEVSQLSTFLLAANPLFLATSVFTQNEFLVTAFVLASFLFYLEKKLSAYVFFSTLAVLTKETAILLCLSILFVEIGEVIKKHKITADALFRLFCFSIPLIIFVCWIIFLKFNGESLWSDWNFSDTADGGSIYTVINNLITFDFWNKYAHQNWKHLFLLNFNWIYSATCVFYIGKIVLDAFWGKTPTESVFTKNTKVVSALILFSLAFVFCVLTFQTYTIPRYTLPLIPFFLILFSLSFMKTLKHFGLPEIFFKMGLFGIVFISLFASNDPVSSFLFKKDIVLGEKIYALHRNLSGNDGITYNLQSAKIAKKRTYIIWLGKNKNTALKSEDCHWIFPDPRNDAKTLKILKLENKVFDNCLTRYGK